MKIFKILLPLLLVTTCQAQYYPGGSTKPHGHSSVSDGGLITNLSMTGALSANSVNTGSYYAIGTTPFLQTPLANSIFMGYNAGVGGPPSGNIYIGERAGFQQGSQNNLFIGNNTGDNYGSGAENLFIGHNIGVGLPGSGASQNLCIGYSACNQNTGSQNTIIGNYAFNSPINSNNSIVIGFGIDAPLISNYLSIGNLITGIIGGSSVTAHGDLYANAFYGDGTNLTGVRDDLGNHIATTTLTMAGNAIIDISSVTLTSATIYDLDGYGRPRAWFYRQGSVLTLGASDQDGDAFDADSEGIVVHNPTTNRMARIKADRFGLTQEDDSGLYQFRVDLSKLFYKGRGGGYAIYTDSATMTTTISTLAVSGSARGFAFKTDKQRITVTNAWQNIEFSSFTFTQNASYAASTFTITTAGLHKITYGVKAWRTNNDLAPTCRLVQSGVEIPGSYGQGTALINTAANITAFALAQIVQGDEIVLQCATQIVQVDELIRWYDDVNTPDPTTFISAELLIEAVY